MDMNMNDIIPPQQPLLQPNDPLTITLQAQEWNIVFEGLNELRMRMARPVFDKMMAQVRAA